MTAAPRLLFVTTVPQSLHFFLGHVAYAKKHGFEVHAMSSPGEWLDRFEKEAQVPVHPIAMSRRITPVRDLGALWRIVRRMRQIRPTIVHSCTPKGGMLGMMAAATCRVPLRIYHILGLPMLTARGLKKRLLTWAEKTSCRLAHHVFSVSESMREVAVAEGLCPADKIKAIHHGGVDGIEVETKYNPSLLPAGTRDVIRTRYQIPTDALVAGFAGRIVRDKGVIELMRAWQVLREEYPSLHLLVAGAKESEDPIPADIEAILHNDPRVHLAGHVMEMPALYSALDVLVLPTYREGFGMVLLEANAMEIPVVSTQIPGVSDAVQDGESGLLVPPQNAEALAAAVRQYLNDPELRRRHGIAGRERVLRNFHPDDFREAQFQEYVRLLRERGIGRSMTFEEQKMEAIKEAV